MIKKILLIFISFMILSGTIYFSDIVHGWASDSGDTDSTILDPGIERYIENVAFGPGEKLSFDIGYGFINAGYATMEVIDVIEYKNRPCYQIISTANSNRFFSSFYPVEDRVESIIDAVGLFSWNFDKKQREGGYRAHRTYSFDQENHTVVYKDSIHVVAPFVQDALSVLYYARTMDLKVGQSLFIDNFTDGKQYPLELKVLKKETVKVEAGKFDCLVVEPLLLSSGIFKHEGRLKVWLTDDRLKMPVLMKSKVLVGSITAELTDYELGEILDF